MNNKKHSNGSLPLSPQLRYSVMHKHPRTTVPLSRKLSQPPPPPPALGSNSDSLVPVSSSWCVDYIVLIGSSYISRDELLRKMYRRRAHYRTFTSKNSDSQRSAEGVIILGPPFDCLFTFPLQYSQESKLIYGPEDSELNTVLARGWRMICSRKMVIRDVGFRHLPDFDRLSFSWVADGSATQLRSIVELIGRSDNDYSIIEGLIECIKCGEIIGIRYILPRRFKFVSSHLLENVDDFVTNIGTTMCTSQFGCYCDGNTNPRVPIISENHGKIDWMFLFCGFSLGYCTDEQLKYFCNQRKLESSGHKNELVRTICLDLISQFLPSSLPAA